MKHKNTAKNIKLTECYQRYQIALNNLKSQTENINHNTQYPKVINSDKSIALNSNIDSQHMDLDHIYKDTICTKDPELSRISHNTVTQETTHAIQLQFLNAINTRNHVLVEELINTGANVQYQKHHTSSHNLIDSPIYRACRNEDVQMVSLLLSHSANVNQKVSNYHETILSYVCEIGNLAIVQELLNANADINLVNPMLFACTNGRTKIVKELIGRGADIDQPNAQGITPLYRAACNGYKDIVHELIQANVKINYYNTPDHNPVLGAARHQYLDIAILLIQGGAKLDDLSVNQLFDYYPPYNLSQEVLELFRAYGINYDQVNSSQKTLQFIKHNINQV